LLKAFLEIGVLVMEDHWTGIPLVAAAIADKALADTDGRIEWGFVCETIPIQRNLVRDMLIARSGRSLRAKLPDLLWRTPPLPWRESREAVAIFPNIKPMRRYFGREAMVIHDLSPLLVPQFHNQDNINHFGNRIFGDVCSTDHFFCDSRATQEDVKLYFGVAQDTTSVIPLGINLNWEDVSAAQRFGDLGKISPNETALCSLAATVGLMSVAESTTRWPSLGFPLIGLYSQALSLSGRKSRSCTTLGSAYTHPSSKGSGFQCLKRPFLGSTSSVPIVPVCLRSRRINAISSIPIA
jgi:hypothetical protein